MVEFALVAPLLFLMIFTIMEGGWLLFHHHQVSNAAREGARYAIVNGEMSGTPANASSIRNHIQDSVYLSNEGSLTVILELDDGNMEPESQITVNVGYAHQTMIGMVYNGGLINLRASSSMMMHY